MEVRGYSQVVIRGRDGHKIYFKRWWRWHRQRWRWSIEGNLVRHTKTLMSYKKEIYFSSREFSLLKIYIREERKIIIVEKGNEEEDENGMESGDDVCVTEIKFCFDLESLILKYYYITLYVYEDSNVLYVINYWCNLKLFRIEIYFATH